MLFRSISEIKKCFIDLKNELSAQNLTTIQRKELETTIKEKYRNKGINYTLHAESCTNMAWESISFSHPPWYINDVGIIKEVRDKGSFPIELGIDDNIEIYYEPRELFDNTYDNNYRENKEFNMLRKFDEYKFHGKITSCSYKLKPNESFEFFINRKNDDAKYLEKKHTKAIRWGILGGGIGVHVGIIVGMIIGYIIQIASCVSSGFSKKTDSPNIGVIIVCAIIGGLIGFYLIYSFNRDKG